MINFRSILKIGNATSELSVDKFGQKQTVVI